MIEVQVADNPQENRYEGYSAGVLVGLAEYRLEGETVVIPHTEVDGDYEGNGIGGRIVRFALDDIRAKGLRVVPTCPFVKAFIQRHPEYADLVA